VSRVDADWVKSPAARRILVHWADPRPAWLWSADGGTLLWRNAAAPWFGAKLKKAGLKLAPAPVPIRGQVPRLIRLGSLGRSSLSRMQFLAGNHPVSTTCAVTPLPLANGETGTLVVGVDPIDPGILALDERATGAGSAALFPPHAEWLLVTPHGEVAGGSEGAEDLAGAIGHERLAALSAERSGQFEIEGLAVTVTRFKASPSDHHLLLFERAAARIAAVRAEEGIAANEQAAVSPVDEPMAPKIESPPEPLLPMDLPAHPAPTAADEAEPLLADEATPRQSLSSLFDRLAGHESLYGELSAADETLVAPPALPVDPPPVTPDRDTPPADAPRAEEPAPDMIAAVIAFADDPEDDGRSGAQSQQALYRVTGRGFAALNTDDADDAPVAAEAEPPAHATALPQEPDGLVPAAADPDIVERVSRYNFDELSRILSDRVAGSDPPPLEPVEPEPAIEPIRPAAVAEGALINVAAETFILNRLPLGIMVFRDQQVLFANRALTDLVAYDSIEALRAAGISAIFPGDDGADAGPVTHLVRRDGTRFPVTARLQSITWQGRPALMLSAAPAIERSGHEMAVRTFAEALAGVRGEGFVVADRAGVITLLSPAAREALGSDDPVGRPLAALVHGDDLAALRQLLEKPARFAETERPGIVVRSAASGSELAIFAEGQAGIVTGYFGFVGGRATEAVAPAEPSEDAADPSMLARISRGVRRPLNTIIGFADLIRSAAFGTIENHRYLEYARDIKTAGQEIAVLVDELDDYARLSAGRYATRPAELDLTGLLDSCVVRVRGQASAARVLVRSAISERLPRIQADRHSLGQAVLNLLASAIDQTPAGGSVIVSAQPGDDGGIVVNVRDSGQAPTDLGDRFVVFRDGVGKDGEPLAPVRSSVGLALTRALVGVNGCTLSVDPAGASGTLFSLAIPPDLVDAIRSA
jgi:signal transduction histidine kinase